MKSTATPVKKVAQPAHTQESIAKLVQERKNALRREFAAPSALNKGYQQKGRQNQARVRVVKSGLR